MEISLLLILGRIQVCFYHFSYSEMSLFLLSAVLILHIILTLTYLYLLLDSAMQKSIPDPSWALPNVKECLSKSDICKNGVISLALSTEDALPQSHTEVLNNDELLENADYASHDSVVSAVTDSGNCSASQTSNGTSPMPNAELEDEAVAKPENCHFRNATPDLSTGSGELNCTVPSNAPKFSNFNEDLIDGDRTLNISSETLVDDSSQLSADILTSPINNLSDELSSTEHSDGQEKVSKSEAAIAVNNVEGQQSGPSSFPSTVATDNDDGDPDEFGVWSSSTVPLELNSALATIASQSNLDSEPMSDCAVFTSPLESQVSKSLDGLEDNDCVRGMIIPDIPGLGDIDDCDDDEFGEFRGTECPDKCSSGAQSIDEPDYDIHFQSPSRRPTLVLSDNVANVTDTQTVHTVEESQDPMDVSSNEPNINSLEENTSVMCNSTEEEICVTNFPSNLSSQDPTFTGDFADEFADFSQAEVEENPASNVWAQAAHTASSIQTSLPSQDPLEFDDFDDYESAEFQSADQKTNPEPPSNSQFDLDTIRSTLGEVLKENFPVPDGNYRSTELENMGTSGLSGLVLDVEESDIWQGLRDLEATPSLSFQWPGSHSNRGLLGALNIDSRNIVSIIDFQPVRL